MVDRGSQGNPAVASAVGAGCIAGAAVCCAVVVDAGFGRAQAPADLSCNSRQTGAGQTESREAPEREPNTATLITMQASQSSAGSAASAVPWLTARTNKRS